MNKDTPNHQIISRAGFLKNSGLLAAGLAFIPGFVSSMVRYELNGVAVGDYKIVVSSHANAIEKEAADQLLGYLSQLSGNHNLSVIEEGRFHGNSGIYIGQTAFAKAAGINLDSLHDEGYLIRSAGNSLIIAGGAAKGVLYGIYDLLEELGFRKFAPDFTVLPKERNITFRNKNKAFTPSVTYRTTSYGQMGGAQEYSDWHKLSSRGSWGLFVHTFHTLVSAQEYGETHPEYYSLIRGKRMPGTQLCLSNPEVAEVLIASLKKRIAQRPDAVYWSVSQDDNDQYCSCDNCRALNEKYGGVPSGSIIYFVNKVAKAIPDKIISTLAYWYSRKAPKNILIEPNVNIMLCNIESRRHGPVFETDPAFSNDLKDWGALSNDILIWDYNIQFTNFFAPFPNLFTIKPNIDFYRENNVNALFMQANNEPAAEMALLRSYLICKLMWDPSADDKAIMDEFTHGYFGAAGPYIRQYIDSMQQSLRESGFSLNIFGDPIDAKEAFLSAGMMARYKQLFDDAEKAVSADTRLLERVQVARLPIIYAAIQIGRTEIDTPRSLYHRESNDMVKAKPEMRKLVNRFVEVCKRHDVRLVRERSGSPDHFLASFNRIFNLMDDTPHVRSFQKKIIPVTKPSDKSKDLQHLTDGVFASYESWQSADQNWVFYTGEHMEFILDLGEAIPVSTVNMDFLNPQAQPDWHLFALPRFVSYALSVDGDQYGEPVRIDNPHDPNPKENPGISQISIFSFHADMRAGTHARYIKVHAENLLKMPSWHIRAGQPASIYSDQIVVK